MVLNISQQGRIGVLHTPLGPDELALLRFDGTDGINELFEYRVEALSDDPNIDFDKLLGEHVSVEILTPYGHKAWFDGIVAEAQWVGVGETGNTYRFILRPWLWLATKRINQRIFHEKSVEDIVNEVLGEYGMGAVSIDVTKNYSPIEYVVQYRESDFNFVSRMMEKYGINYSFNHSQGQHELFLWDSTDSVPPIAGGDRKYYGTKSGAHSNDEESFWGFSPKRQVTSGKVVATDYNFKKPSTAMLKEHMGNSTYATNRLEVFEYPGHYLEADDGQPMTQLRMEQELSADNRITASGNVTSLCSGMVVNIDGHLHTDWVGVEYLCVRAHHSFRSENYGSGGTVTQKEVFVGHYEIVKSEHPFFPERKTERVRVQGPQTAFVVGDEDEIDCDEHGRILVLFHWDRNSSRSMRVRCAQMWAGNGWGSMYIPRIGMEVVVEFLEGDPDKPLVTGCVYNAANVPPYELPGEKNLAGIKSDSTVGGDGYNELVFDDTKKAELFRQHAQKDMLTKVLNDETREVDNNRTTTIGNDETRVVKNNEDHNIKNNSTYHIESNETRWIDGNNKEEIGGNEKHEVIGKRDTKIKGNEKLDVSGTTTIKSIGAMKIESLASIELKVGGSTIKMDPMNITIKAMNTTVKANLNLETSAGLMATHKAGAIMTIQGSLVKIN